MSDKSTTETRRGNPSDLKEKTHLLKEDQILIFAPTGNDAKLTAQFLAKGGQQVRVCQNMPELCREVEQGCGVILLAEETLAAKSVDALVEALASQPEWSDIPVCIITSGGEVTQERLRRLGIFGPGGNVTLLERPFRPGTLCSTVEVALRSRRRQYEMRDLVKKLRASEEGFRRIFEQTTGGIAEMDLSGRFTLVNKRYCEIVGRNQGELMGLRMEDITHDEDKPKIIRQFQALANEKGPNFMTERRFIRPDGSHIWAQSHISAIRDPNGVTTGVAAISTDITERKRAEAANEGQQHVLQFIVEEAALERILEAIVKMVESVTFHKMYASILLLDESGQFLHQGAAPSLPQAYNRAIDGIKIGPKVGSCGTAAFSKAPVYVSNIGTSPLWADFKDLALKHGLHACWSTPIFSGNKTVLGTFAMYYTEPREPNPEDLKIVEAATRTAAVAIERKRSDAAMRESEERFRTMADTITQFAWIMDAAGNLTWVNKRWLEYTGETFDDVKGWGWIKAHHPDHVERVVKKINECFKTGELWEDTYPLRGRDGSYRWFLSSAVPIRDSEGKVVQWFGTNTDITERLEAQALLEKIVMERTEELSETNTQLETLVYSIAHDLRAPLRSMQAFAKILLEDYAPNLDKTAEDYTRRIIRSAETMDTLVLDLLNYGRVARADMALKNVDLNALWPTVIAQFELIIQERGARIETASPLPAVRAHEASLGQALANLLGNALKFIAPDKRPHIRFRAEEKINVIRLWVEDNGIGILPQYHDRIFRVFERLHSKEFEGTGIGLSIVRKGIERMGGRVGLESEGNGSGSRFWIDLPKASA